MRSSVSLPQLPSPTQSDSLKRRGAPNRRTSLRRSVTAAKPLLLDKSVAPTLKTFKDEHVIDKSLGKDDHFPGWLLKRQDFLKMFPRYCENDKVFDSIAQDIPSEYFVNRALRHSQFMRNLDEATILSLTKKCILSYCPDGHEIFKQGDVADGMFIVVRGSVSIRITTAPSRRLRG